MSLAIDATHLTRLTSASTVPLTRGSGGLGARLERDVGTRDKTRIESIYITRFHELIAAALLLIRVRFQPSTRSR